MKAENATEEDEELTPFKRIYVPLSPAPAIAQPEPLRLRPTLVLSSNSHLLQYQYHCSPRSNHHRPWLTRSTGNIQDPPSTHALARLFSRHQQHFIELVDTDHPFFYSSIRPGRGSGVGCGRGRGGRSLGGHGRIAGRRIIIFQLRMT